MMTHTNKDGQWSNDDSRDVYVSAYMTVALKLQHVSNLFWNCLKLHDPKLFLIFHLGKSLHPSYSGREREG
jgi:hypothetical protein